MPESVDVSFQIGNLVLRVAHKLLAIGSDARVPEHQLVGVRPYIVVVACEAAGPLVGA